MALTETRTRFVPPFAVRMRMRCRFGRNLRGVMLVTCVPMPPLFLLCPLRLMREPLTGRLPVIAQMRAMMEWVKRSDYGGPPGRCKGNLCCAAPT